MKAPVAVSRALTALALIALGSAWGCSRVEKAPFVPTLDASSRRSTQGGDVVGFEGPYGNHAWLGIPFARPPVGERRWRAPEPPDRWSGSREALASGPRCPQFASSMGEEGVEPGTPIGSEDCLYLNVFAPRFPEGEVPTGAERLPVMVWIHGGGNTMGHAGFYEAGNLAATHRVVVVATNYRLGPFGWFRHASLRGAGTSPAEHSGNFGTLDLLHALRWVRENAAAFGGDPGKVTIFGESAGGQNVYSLLLSPLARGLFHRAIAQSGAIGLETRAHAENLADDPDPGALASSGETVLRLVELAGQAQDREGAKARVVALPPDDLARWLRARSDREIQAAYVSGGGGIFSMPNVFRDGVVLPDADAQTLLASGRYNRVPAVLGSNRDENKLFMALDHRHTMLIKGVPLWVKDMDGYQREASYRSAMWKASAVDEPAAAMSRAQGPSVFAYRFDWDELPRILWVDLARILGASHGFEIPFVFGHFDLGRSARLLWSAESEPGRRALSAAMMSYWAQFAATGDPARGRAGDLPRWEAFGGELPKGARLLVLDTAEGGGIRVSRDTASVEDLVARIEADGSFEDARERCELLASLMAWTPQFTRERYARIAACSGLGPLASR